MAFFSKGGGICLINYTLTWFMVFFVFQPSDQDIHLPTGIFKALCPWILDKRKFVFPHFLIMYVLVLFGYCNVFVGRDRYIIICKYFRRLSHSQLKDKCPLTCCAIIRRKKRVIYCTIMCIFLRQWNKRIGRMLCKIKAGHDIKIYILHFVALEISSTCFESQSFAVYLLPRAGTS